MQRSTVTLFLSLLVTTFSLTATGFDQEPMPLTHGKNIEGVPSWVSIDYLESSLESLSDKGRQGERLQERVAGELQQAIPGKCLPEWSVGRPFPGFGTLPEALKGADFILVGTVTGVSAGFASAVPGTMYRFEPKEFLLGKFSFDAKHYFRDRHIDVEFRGKHLCRRNSWRTPSPEVGDRVVIVRKYPDGWLSGNHLHEDLGALGEGEMILLAKDGQVHLPRRYLVAHPEWQEKGATAFLDWLRDLREEDQ